MMGAEEMPDIRKPEPGQRALIGPCCRKNPFNVIEISLQQQGQLATGFCRDCVLGCILGCVLQQPPATLSESAICIHSVFDRTRTQKIKSIFQRTTTEMTGKIQKMTTKGRRTKRRTMTRTTQTEVIGQPHPRYQEPPARSPLLSASIQNSTLEVRTILADANFENLARGEMRWEGDHLRIVLTVNDSKAIDKPIVSELC